MQNNQNIEMDHLLVLDTETASISKEDGVVEIAWVEIDDNFNVLSETCAKINPPGAISPGASGVHGITKDMVKDCPTLDQFMAGNDGRLLRDKVILVIGHNAAFDIKYIEDYAAKVHKLCTLKLARLAFPKDPEGQSEWYSPPPDHKLPTLMYYLGLQVKGTHNALDDVYTCLQLLQKCCEKLGVDLEGAYALCNKPVLVKKMEFGKHRGRKLAELPKDYVTWLLNSCDNLDENLRYSLEQL
jgi:exodeoxyribonuclease X